MNALAAELGSSVILRGLPHGDRGLYYRRLLMSTTVINMIAGVAMVIFGVVRLVVD
jgi:hypothetical protein